jgi:hypothetical protein
VSGGGYFDGNFLPEEAGIDAGLGGGYDPQKTWPNLELLPPHNVIGEKWYPKIRSMINDIFGSDACRQAFKDAGFDLKVLGDKGFLIGSSTLLSDNSITDAQLGLSSAARQAAVQKLNSSSFYGLTITANSGSDQRSRIFITQDAFTAGGFFSSSESSLRQVIIHELIHAAGAQGKDPGWWSYLGYDDLSYMQKQYNKIEKACGGS